MLTITVHNEENLASFTLRGDLCGSGVEELKAYYRVLSVFPCQKSVVVDLTGVSAIDSGGKDLLAHMVRGGAELVFGKPMTEHLLNEVNGLIRASEVARAVAARKQSHQERPPVSLKNILFATDFSPCSEAVLPYAAAIARRHGSRIYIAHVIPSEAYGHVPLEARNDALVSAKRFVESQVSKLLESSYFRGVPHEVVVNHGEVWPILSEIVEEKHIDLIAVGTHGRRGVKKMLWGSIAEEIFRLATKPVLTAGPQILRGSAPEVRFHRILYATDFSSASMRAMDYACSLTQEHESRLFFLYVTPKLGEEPAEVRMREAAFLKECLEDFQLQSGSEVQPEFIIEFGSPAAGIMKAAEERKIDLIVLGIRSQSGHLGLTGTHLPGPTAYSVASEARCPVLTVRGGAPAA